MEFHICPDEVRALMSVGQHLVNYTCGCVYNMLSNQWATRCLAYWSGKCKETKH